MSIGALQGFTLDLDAGLRALGYEAFRPGQREAIETLLDKGRLLLVAPTGDGKSLAYQLPASMLPGTTLVVSPLIALMHDQVQALTARGVPATYLASTLDADEHRSRLADLAAGCFKLVYIAPERLALGGFRRIIRDLDCPLIVIDEAHCISEWGHDFRPEYLQIGELLTDLAGSAVMACTATATPVVRDEIVARLGLPADTPQLLRGFARPNLSLRAAEIPSRKAGRELVDAQLREALGEPESALGAAIIYSPTRRMSEQEAERLSRDGWRASAYHAGLTAHRRERAQAGFTNGKLNVVVATNAFGMGIDRADVRVVIHLAPPGSIESYYQEVGRAGRDGQPAYGLCLTSTQDMPLRRRLLESPTDGRVPSAEVVEHKWQMFLELMRWIEGGSCRHDAILRYFGDEQEILDGCGRCDVCLGLNAQEAQDPEEVTLTVRKALSGVARVSGRLGMRAAVKLLKGQDDERLQRQGLCAVRTFGVLSDHSTDWLTQLLRRCVTAGWVGFTADERPLILITPEGSQVMHGDRPVRLLLPSSSARPAAGHRGVLRPRTKVDMELSEEQQVLFEALRAHRLTVAQKEGIPAYLVASDRTLRDMAMLKPRTRSELLMVHGIGPTKVQRYGEGLLSVMAERARDL